MSLIFFIKNKVFDYLPQELVETGTGHLWNIQAEIDTFQR